MPRFDTVARNKYKRVLLFGPPKVGKSLLAGKCAEEYKLDWHDGEDGSEVLRKLPEDWQKNITLFSYPDTTTYPILADVWRKIVRPGIYNICHVHGKPGCSICSKPEQYDVFDTQTPDEKRIVVFDSLTQLTASATAFVVKKLQKADAKLQVEDIKFTFDEWAVQGRIVDAFLSHIQQAQYHVICISHETEVEMEDGKNKLVATLGTRNFSRNSAKAFGHVIYCEVNSGKHSFGSSTTYKNNVVTGSRTEMKLESMAIPSLLPIFRGEIPENNSDGGNGDKSPGQLALEKLKAGIKK